MKEKRERARGVLLYLEEIYEQVEEKITNFDSFSEEIKVVLYKYINVFDTKLRKCMNVELMQLNVREGSKPYACVSSRPTPAHYRETARKLVQDLLDQRVIQRCPGPLRGETRQSSPGTSAGRGFHPPEQAADSRPTPGLPRGRGDQAAAGGRLQGVDLHGRASRIFPDKSQE